jgi:antitoxin component YwqK of YwqJK toxin-antitoxin module
MDSIMKKIILFLSILAITSCGYHQSESPYSLVAIQVEDRNGLTETVSTPERLEAYKRLDYTMPQPYKKVLRIFKNNGKSHSKITTYHANGTICQYLEAEEMRAHGAYKEWHPNGQIKIQAHVIGGTADISSTAQKDWLFEGVNQVWNEKGQILAEILYEKGVMEGTSVYFYPSGEIEKHLSFKKNILDGEAIEYHLSGKIRSKTQFLQGRKQGTSLGYFANGQPAWLEEYSEGLLLQGTYYTPQGEILSEVEDGRGRQAIYIGDVLSLLVETRRGSSEGIVKKFTPKGDLQSSYFVKEGKKQGEEIEYFLPYELAEEEKQPKAKLSIHWDQNIIHGIVKTWYNNGNLQSQRDYCRNQKQGSSLAWYKSGSLMFIEEYEQGQLTKGSYYKKNQNEPVSTITNGNGISTLYDDEGIFLKKITYIKGKPVDPED